MRRVTFALALSVLGALAAPPRRVHAQPTVLADSARRLDGIPEVVLADDAPSPAPVRVGDDELVVVATGSGSTLVRRDGDTWSSTEGPGGTPVSAVVLGGDLWVVTTDDEGSGTLSVARVA